MSTPNSGDIFISYASVDRQRVLTLLEQFREHGIHFWRDQDQLLGASIYGSSIVQAIQQAKVLVLVCSQSSLLSPNVRNEIINNWERGSRCYLPIWIEPPSEIPESIAYWLAGCQWIETHAVPADEWMPRVLRALKSLGITPQPKKTVERSSTASAEEPIPQVNSTASPGNEGKNRLETRQPVTLRNSNNWARPLISSIEIAQREHSRWLDELRLSEPHESALEFCGMRFCLIPPGSCSMGAPAHDLMAEQDEKPAIPIEIPNPLFVMQTPLMCGDVRAHLSKLFAHQRWRQWDRTHQNSADTCPAADLGLLHLQEYCDVFRHETGVPLRLPTEAEWEYFARAGATGRYWWGDEFGPDKVIHSARQPTEASLSRRNTWGLIDVLGNIAEWTASAYGPLNSQSPMLQAPSTGVESRYRVVRGGSFRELRPADLRLSRRQRVAADSTARYIGARLVAEVSDVLAVMQQAAQTKKGPS